MSFTIRSDRSVIVALEAIAPDGRRVIEWLSDDSQVAYKVMMAALDAVADDLDRHQADFGPIMDAFSAIPPDTSA